MTTPHPYPGYKPSAVSWLGDVPQHWRVSPVKHCYEVQLGKMLQNTPKSVDDEEVPYLKAVNVQWFSVQNADSPTMWANPREIKQFGITKGDLLVCEGGEGGRCGLISSDIEGYIIQNALHRVRPKGLGTNPYLQYAMYAAAEYGWFDALNNKATIAHFTSEKLGAFLIPLPPLPEQRAIVRYLDHVDERIQRYVDAKEKLVALLEEEKQAVINRAVTRGLDPNVRLKPSGVDWLGDVPEHWEMRRLKTVGEAVIGLTYRPQDLTDEGAGILVLRASNILNGGLVYRDNVYVSSVIPPKLITREGDILICSRSGSRALIGKNALIGSQSAGTTFGAFMTVFRSHNNDYLHQLFNSRLFEYQSAAFFTSTINQLTLGILYNMKIPFPPIEERQSILQYLEEASGPINAAITRARRQIELLQEYRTRLIADVVTGKVDVREAASQLPEHTMTESG